MAKKKTKKFVGYTIYKNTTGLYYFKNGILLNSDGDRVRANNIGTKNDPLVNMKEKT